MHHSNDSQGSIVKHFVVAFPLVLIILQSYFKFSILAATKEIVPAPWGDVAYWVLRASLFVTFVVALARLPLGCVGKGINPVDIYDVNRSALDPLLGLRALACLNVFIGHWFLVVFAPTTPPQSVADSVLRLVFGFSPWCGVWMFFTLSGYLMGKGFVTSRHLTSNEGLARFYFNRSRRIFPVYFISIFVIAVLIRPEILDLRNMSTWNALLASVLFDDQGGGVIGALWSVSTEFQFYLIAPFLFLLLTAFSKKTRLLVVLAAAVLIILCVAKYKTLNATPGLWHSRVYFPMLPNLDCFFLGMIAAFVVNNMRYKGFYIRNGLKIGICLAAFSQVALSLWSFHEMVSYPGYSGSSSRIFYLSFAPALTAIFTSLIIFVFEISERSEVGWSGVWRVSRFFGSITYCLYVLHEPVFLSIRKLFPQNISIVESILIFPFGFVLSVGFASIFYFLIEVYFDKLPYSSTGWCRSTEGR